MRKFLPSSAYVSMKRRAVDLAGGHMFYWAQLLAGMEYPKQANPVQYSGSGADNADSENGDGGGNGGDDDDEEEDEELKKQMHASFNVKAEKKVRRAVR